MHWHLVAENVDDAIQDLKIGILRLQVGDRRIDFEGAQRRVIPGQFVGRRQQLEVVGAAWSEW